MDILKRPRLDAIAIETTRRCNLKCRYCYTADDDVRSYKRKLSKELRTQEIEDLLKQAVNLDIGGVTWSGGEFFQREDALDLLAFATKLGMHSHIATNSTRLTRDVLKEIKSITNRKVFLSFSINSIDHKDNSWGRDDSPQTVFRAMKTCDELDIGYFIILTIGKFNLKHLRKTIEYFQERNILVLRSPLVPRGKGRLLFKDFAIDREEMQQIVHPVFREHSATYISFTPCFVSPEFIEKENPSFEAVQPGCWVGRGPVISPEGNVGTCLNMVDSVSVGNIREGSLRDLICSDEFVSLLSRDKLKGKCGRCRYKYTCGGCRAMAFYQNGDYFAEDPLCFFEPRDRNTRSEYEELCTKKYKEFMHMPSRIHLFFASVMLERLFNRPPGGNSSTRPMEALRQDSLE